MHNPMTPHQLQTAQHLHREPPNEGSREPGKLVGLDELVQIDTEQLGDDTQVRPEVEVIRHADHVMLVFRILYGQLLIRSAPERAARLTHSTSWPRILVSTIACAWNRFLFRIILTATLLPVL